MGGNGSHSSGSGTGRDFPPVFSWDWDGKRLFFVGVGRERFENSLPCHPLLWAPERPNTGTVSSLKLSISWTLDIKRGTHKHYYTLFIHHILIFSFQICTYQTCTHITVYIIYCVFAILYIAYLYIILYYLCPVLLLSFCCTVELLSL